MLRVLHVIGGMGAGGAEAMIMNLYRHIDKEEIQFDFLVHTSKECFYDKEILLLGGRIFRAEKYSILNHCHYKRQIDHFMSSHPEIDIVHGHINSCAFIYLKSAKTHHKKTILHCHATKRTDRTVRAAAFELSVRLARRIPDYYLACSRNAGKSRFGDKILAGGNFQILENGIDAPRFSFDPSMRKRIRNENGIENSQIVIGHVGRFTYAKNHQFLLDVFERFHKRHPNAVLWLIGDGELKAEIQKQAAVRPCADAICFLGVKNNISDYLQGMDAFLFPSVFEGLGISLVEAQASGLPCLASDRIQDEADMQAGLLHRLSLDIGAEVWADKLYEILSESRTRIDTRAYIEAAGYDISCSANKLTAIYRRLMK